MLRTLLVSRPLTLGMKRGIEPGVLSLMAFESLPQDVVLEILHHALDDAGKSLKQFKAALEIRMTSVRLRNLIDVEVLGNVSELSYEVYGVINDELITFFSGLRRLECWQIKPQTTERFFDSFTRLEYLQTRQDALNDVALRRLTTLHTLVLDESYSLHITGYGVETLTNLTTLHIARDSWNGDTGLLPLSPFLKHLTLMGSCIGGLSFASMSRLESLCIGAESRIDDSDLSLVGSTLETLSLMRCFFVGGDCFTTMTRLGELFIQGDSYLLSKLPILSDTLTKLSLCDVSMDNHRDATSDILSLTRLSDLVLIGSHSIVTNTILSQITSLTKLDIGVSDSITNEGLIPLRHMRELEVNYRITGEALVNMRESLEMITLKMFGKIHWVDLVRCVALKIIHVPSFAYLNAPMSQEAIERETGITFVTNV